MNELELKIERLEELKKIGFKNLQGAERAEYSVLLKELEGEELPESPPTSEDKGGDEEGKKKKKSKGEGNADVEVVFVLDRNVRYKGIVWKKGEEVGPSSSNFDFFQSLGFLTKKIKD